MAETTWFTERLRELCETEPDSRDALRAKIREKIEFVDSCIQHGRALGQIALSKGLWEAPSAVLRDQNEAVAKFRNRCSELGLPLRPELFHDPEERPEAAEPQQLAEAEATSASASSPEKIRSPTKILYLKAAAGINGVLQLHKALDATLQGYVHLWRVEEIWPEQQGTQIAKAWKVDLGIHLPRRQDYKGKIDIVGVGLQVRGCKPPLQEAAMGCLHVVLAACVPRDLDLDLLPGCPDCLIRVRNYEVQLDSLNDFLEFTNLRQRWRFTKIFTKGQQKLQTGIKLHVLAWFLLRVPFLDSFEDISYSRLQRRLLHRLSQAAEQNFPAILRPDLPVLQADHKLHPAKKCLATSIYFSDSGGGGFLGATSDQSLENMDLKGVTAADFYFRYIRKTGEILAEEIAKMTLKSFSVLCDASPKGHMSVWLPVVCCNDFAAVGTLQKMDPHHVSEVDTATKMKAAAQIAGATADLLVADRPRKIKEVHQKKLAAKEQLQALHNCIQHMGINFDQLWPDESLRPINPLMEQRLCHRFEGEDRMYVHNAMTSECHWEPLNGAHYRLVLAPDEAKSQAAQCLQERPAVHESDEEILGCAFAWNVHADIVDITLPTIPLESAIGSDIKEDYGHTPQHTLSDQARPDDVLQEMFGKDILLENGLAPTENEDEDFENVVGILSKLVKPLGFHNAGVNPFHILSKQADVEAPESSFEKVVDLTALRVNFSRDPLTAETLLEQVLAYLACCFELLEYASYLRSFPALSAALLATESTEATRAQVLQEAKAEWSTVLDMEKSTAGQLLLKKHCLFTTFQCYRELHSVCERHGYKFVEQIGEVVKAWYPAFGQSSNLENVFREMEYAVRKSGVPQDDLTNLGCVAVRALGRRICNESEEKLTPATPELTEKDWEGKEVRALKHKIWSPTSALPCKNIRLEEILKPFATTNGESPIDASNHFWVASNTYAVIHVSWIHLLAIALQELPWCFKGPLPPASGKEISCAGKAKRKTEDPFQHSEDSTPALCFLSGPNIFRHVRMTPQQAEIFQCTFHVADAALAAKTGSIVIRRAPRGWSLLVFLFRTERILTITSAALTELLLLEGMRLPKNAAKAAKIRKLMESTSVAEHTDQNLRDKIEAQLLHQDQKKKRKGDTGDEQDEEGDVEQAEQEIDPACVACEQLLADLDREEEADRVDEEGEAAVETAEEKDARLRASRALLTKSSAVPSFLVEKFADIFEGKKLGMAETTWFTERLRELCETEPDSRDALRAKIREKIEFVDSCIQHGRALGQIALSKGLWEAPSAVLRDQNEAVAKFRNRCSELGLPLRPELFHDPEERPEAAEPQQLAEAEATSASASSPEKIRSPTKILYLKAAAGINGVLQLHKALDATLQGYVHLWRVEEIWPEQQGTQIAKAWKVDLGIHLPRRQDYKGKIDIVGVGLQVRGCKPPLQEAAMGCLIRVRNYEVQLDSLNDFLEFTNLRQRWRFTKIFTKGQQKLQTGIKLHVLAWFLLRVPFLDSFEDISYSRLQRRLLHRLSQAAEQNFPAILRPDLPVLQADHKLHPAKKGGGFLGATSDQSLENMDLKGVLPVHYSRTAADFYFRYIRKTGEILAEEIAKMTLKSFSVLCDASPKGHMSVWLPVVCCNDFAAVGTLQKMDPHHVSEVDTATKMKAAAQIAGATADLLVADRPRKIKEVHQKKLAAKEQLQALHNCIQHMGINFDQLWPDESLRPINPLMEQRLCHRFEGEDRMYVHNAMTSECHWEPLNGAHYRLVLAPDEGSSLFTGFMFLASKGAAIGFNRDEWNGLAPTENEDEDFENVVGILSKLVKPLGFHNAGVNPFHILSKQADVEAPESSFEKVVDLTALRVNFSRDPLTAETLLEQVLAYLACCFELLEYASYLRSFPALSAALLATESTEATRAQVLQEAKAEWSTVLDMEKSTAGQLLLKKHCLFTTFQCYRELHSVCERHGYKFVEQIGEVVKAWYPAFGQSSNLENVFREMEYAVRKSGVPQDDLTNLGCVAVRALGRRICNESEEKLTPATPELTEKDWEGKEVRALKHKIWSPTSALPCKNIRLEEILKPFATTNGESPIDASNHFWVASCFERGVVFRHEGKFFMCTGNTYKRTTNIRDAWASFPLQAEIFQCTFHVADAALAAKTGSIVIRRAPRGWSLLVFLFRTERILTITSAALTELLLLEGMRLPKNAAKAAKIRKLMESTSVAEHTDQNLRDKIEAQLLHQDQKKKRKGDTGDEQDEEGDVEQAEQEIDPACVACEQLLADLDREEEADRVDATGPIFNICSRVNYKINVLDLCKLTQRKHSTDPH
ncbi:unnamed protein product [Symbiodinium sp. CCMP2592]|nr:unnamed protein product [Symbiodinium sp. CCMP2592]